MNASPTTAPAETPAAPPAASPRRTPRVVRFRGLSFRVAPRYAAVCVLLLAAGLTVGVLAVGTGTFSLTPVEVVRTLLGDGPPGADYIVNELRLPRALDGLLAGAAFGMSGAAFQSVTRNPLGSPDLIGFSHGAATGAVVVILVLHESAAAIAAGALIGGLAAALAVYLLAWRRGVSGGRLVLVGIGAAGLLGAVNDYLLSRAGLGDAAQAAAWLTGSLGGRQWRDVTVVGLGALVLMPVILSCSRRLSLLEMGDATAGALGGSPERTRLVLLASATGLCGLAVAAAGPVPFIALAAPQVARRITRTPGPNLLAAALTGATLLVLADWLTQRLVPLPMPVGVATGLLGGTYLVWLLISERRRGTF
ncbi:iron chelate uptake ABC transporter family permease subunit [Streptomyces sp. RFCAC02]|uniref:FecCD family ABC transporter permease n=1 Tax=Streptomyces sp. RFCAC02 TaxID=2499143 RepID=UPI001021B3BF|nr:iron chelate uptake ABC transporter family permease subunit [Streptomyces sp. RFCAC02]